MASNRIDRTQSRLWALADDAADGLKSHGDAVGVKQNPEAAVRLDLKNSQDAQKLFAGAGAAEDLALAAHRVANSNVKGFLALAKRMLADPAGDLPPGLWPAGTTAIPDDETRRLALLGKIADHLRDHPAAAVAQKGFTETAARAAHVTLAGSDTVTGARAALNDAVRARVKAKAARDAADTALYQRLSGLLAELGQLLPDASEDWYWFGFVPPAGAERPARADGLHLEQVGPTTLMAGWPHPPRAEKVRVLVQVVGRDAAFVPREWNRDNDTAIEGLPIGATVRVQLQAANAAGDGPAGEVVEITLSS